MNKRVIAAVSAGVLALLGVLVLVLYAQGANDRAFEGAKLVSVIRLTTDVPAGTSSAELQEKTEVIELPSAAVADGAVTGLDQVTGKQTNASVQKGEILLASRMVAPGTASRGASDVPRGFQEVSFSIETQRGVADSIKPGDRIGIVGSYDQPTAGRNTTRMILKNVLVTKVSGGPVTEEVAVTSATLTVALQTTDVQKLVFTQEFGRTWLTLQNADTDQSGDASITVEGVLK